MLRINDEHILIAYKKLKRWVYYDKNDLTLRLKLAKFECAQDFEERLRNVKEVINDRNQFNKIFAGWLDQINFRLLPKGLIRVVDEEKAEDNGTYISNVTSGKLLNVERVNYFFDGPIELHLIAVLWIMFEGRHLDSQLGEECFGSRLERDLFNSKDKTANLFRKYHELYSKWRDTGIKKAKQILVEENHNVCLLGLDIKEYYYHIRLDFDEVAESINQVDSDEEYLESSKFLRTKLRNYLRDIGIAYHRKTAQCMKLTHEHIRVLSDNNNDREMGLPLGLCSSPLLANWYLRKFDQVIKEIIRPAYYGRYIDDMLLVIRHDDDPSKKGEPVKGLINRIFVQNDIFLERQVNPDEASKFEVRYEMSEPRGLYIQLEKCILQYFNANHSIAGLEKFQKKLEKSGSDFRLLPVDEGESSLEEVAYDLLYDGSINKFRSVKGLVENRFELAKLLAKQTILHLTTDDQPDKKISEALKRFFKGKNAIEFYDMWERVLTFLVVVKDAKSRTDFEKNVESEIKRARFGESTNVASLIQKNLQSHLNVSISMADALSKRTDASNDPIIEEEALRSANLIRHHFVLLPLINYTSYNGSLISRYLDDALDNLKINEQKVKLSPRYVNFDECLMLSYGCNSNYKGQSHFNWAENLYYKINGQKIDGVEWSEMKR